ncbi:hypothetical protein like AT3G61520 [Hibiscus trionum]|uniref:Pentatricopeptide repeat-containing protein n=1 Tax=Hibiscus trionum TaxID=183268 RepID=A0A9W7GX38_HIBTR|nr:hypothetical protein like AT3G61520 [Hibiscus trionum]
MNTTLLVSKHSELLRLLKLQPSYYLLHRRLCAGPNPQPPYPPPQPPQEDESKITQAVKLLLETPHQEWFCSQPLQSLLFTSSPPSPCFFFKITHSLPSYCQAFNFFKHLQQRFPSEDTHFLSYPFQAVLEQAGRELDAGSRLFELYQASKDWKIPLTVSAAALLIRYFGRLEMVDKSVLIFNELDPSLKTTHVRNVLIDVLLRDGRVEYALEVLDEMLQPISDVPPDDVTGDIIFHGLVKRNRKGVNLIEEELIKLVLLLGRHGVFPNTNWLTRLISKLCRIGKFNQACNLLHELLRLQAPLEAPPFNVLLTGLGRRRDVKGMISVLAEMKESDIKPDVVTFGILINHLCKLLSIDDAMEVFNKISEESGSDGLSIEADVVIYNTLIDGLCKAGRVEEGLQLMERMKSAQGLAPDMITYTCLIDGFCKVGEIERGKELFDRMIEEGVLPDVASLNILVDGMCKHGRINSAIEFFNDMQGKGLKGNAVTYTTLITAFCDVDNFDNALDLFDQMLRSECSADVTVYHNLIHCLCKTGRMDDADSLLLKFKQAGVCLDSVCYNALVNGFFKKNDVYKAYEIVKEMEKVGLKPDSVTYDTLIAYFCRSGNSALALRVMKQMVKNGLVPTITRFEALIRACCLNGKTKQAVKLFNDLSSITKTPPKNITYNILIESLCKNNEVKVALSLVEDMKAKGVKPDTTTYNAIFKGLKENNLLEDGLVLMDEMIENGWCPDNTTMEILTEWLSGAGELEKLKSFKHGNKVSTSTT